MHRPGESFSILGIAVDFVQFDPANQERMAAIRNGSDSVFDESIC
ncbi:MAG TPA: hypothetical protein VK789_32315 [Bryobacteraceae bacterium]|nr:hypothetical protein [Bryobacteraceae bacterium]